MLVKLMKQRCGVKYIYRQGVAVDMLVSLLNRPGPAWLFEHASECILETWYLVIHLTTGRHASCCGELLSKNE